MARRNEVINVFLIAIATVIVNAVVASILIILSIPLLQSILAIGFALLYAGLLIGVSQLLYIISLCIYGIGGSDPRSSKELLLVRHSPFS